MFFIRFCSEQYHPFAQENVKKYVVGDDYRPIWEVPSLNGLYNDMMYSMKDTILGHVNKEGL